MKNLLFFLFIFLFFKTNAQLTSKVATWDTLTSINQGGILDANQICWPWGATIDSSRSRLGRKSVRMELRSSDSCNNSVRTEFKWPTSASTRWWSFSVYMGDDYIYDALPECITQLTGADWTKDIPFELIIVNDRYKAQKQYWPDGVNKKVESWDLGPVLKNQWVDWVFNFEPSVTAGRIQIWKNGVKVLDNNAANWNLGASLTYYLKFGIYKWPWKSKGPTDNRVFVPNKRVAWFDEAKIGAGASTYATFAYPNPITNLALDTVKTNVSCFGGNGSISITPLDGQSPYTYSWSNGATTSDITVPAGTYTVFVQDANRKVTRDTFIVTQPSAALSSTYTAGTITTIGGTTTVSISASGGTFPYTGVGNFTQGLGTTIYTVTDANGCTVKDTVTLTATLSPISVSLTTTTPGCNGDSTGSISSSVSGGAAPYTYLWNDGQTTSTATGLTAGSYSLTVTDAAMQTTTQAITLTQPLALTVSATQNTKATVTISASGGTAPYTGIGSYPNQREGAQTYTVTDANGCSVSVTIIVQRKISQKVIATNTKFLKGYF